MREASLKDKDNCSHTIFVLNAERGEQGGIENFMKKFFAIFRVMVLGALVLPMGSCSEDVPQEEVSKSDPVLTVPDGYVNYFEKEEVHFDYPATEFKLIFQVDADWWIRFDDNGGEMRKWCSATPESGGAGLNEVTISLSDNYDKWQRIGDILICSRYADGSTHPLFLESLRIRQDNRQYEDPVDLGLSVKWASWNLRAYSPEGDGIPCAWGDQGNTTSEIVAPWTKYKWCEGSWDSMTKYCTDSYYGTVDNKTTLDPEDDYANLYWGNGWRVPTKEEMQELVEKCTWISLELNGVEGFRIVGPNGNKIFLPTPGYSSGHDYYWTNALDESDNRNAYVLEIDDYRRYGFGTAQRYRDGYIRPVKK